MSKPFKLADAKAGHPVQTVAGQHSVILSFESPVVGYPLIGVIGDVTVASWTADGWNGYSPLVMAPIGTINGKPVYPGDMITAYGKTFPVLRADEIGKDSKWPRVYPETQMNNEEVRKALHDAVQHIDVANAAIRHGIDNGYLLDPREMQVTMSIKVPELSPEELQRIVSGDTGRASIIYNQGPITYGELQKLATALGIHRTDTFDDVKDKIKQRERGLVQLGIDEGWRKNCESLGHIVGKLPYFPDTSLDALIAKVK